MIWNTKCSSQSSYPHIYSPKNFFTYELKEAWRSPLWRGFLHSEKSHKWLQHMSLERAAEKILFKASQSFCPFSIFLAKIIQKGCLSTHPQAQLNCPLLWEIKSWHMLSMTCICYQKPALIQFCEEVHHTRTYYAPTVSLKLFTDIMRKLEYDVQMHIFAFLPDRIALVLKGWSFESTFFFFRGFNFPAIFCLNTFFFSPHSWW